MTLLAEIHSLPCSTLQALGTTAGYSLHRRATLLPGQKPSQLLVLEICWALINFELQSPSELVPKFFKARNATVVRLLIGWSSMASPVLITWATFSDTHLSIPFSKGHWPRSVSPVLEPLCLTDDKKKPDGLTLNSWYKGKILIWDTTVVDIFAPSHYIVIAAKPGSVATDAETDKCWKQWSP